MALFKLFRDVQRVRVPVETRTLVITEGEVRDILRPGTHDVPAIETRFETLDPAVPRIQSVLVERFVRDHPEAAANHVMVVRTGPEEVSVVERDGVVFAVIAPDTRALFWADAGPWTVTPVDLAVDTTVEPVLARRLQRAHLNFEVAAFQVRTGQVGLLFTDGEHSGRLDPGMHWFWRFGRSHEVRLVETRWQTKEVAGQEILTKDRVTLRVTLTATFRVVDPIKAVTEVTDHGEALHRALQLAFRKTVGALPLDRLLAEKGQVDAKAAEVVRQDMEGIGIELGEIALKDVILPGEMRDILNKVVAAQKEAEANVIRRREETNATRSLLNTAKVLADNPVMLRLKELEALETIASKVDQLTVHNGTEGLLSDVVKLRG
ncbi:slipin family protein [Nioella nitratireducens]|uniref:slipin family protein n=1 Tax=Nioella nitratireducens TaxID=1287720 RepID=UPI0008FD0EC0|nr:slipin family protein [Nioella nitratireducens]